MHVYKTDYVLFVCTYSFRRRDDNVDDDDDDDDDDNSIIIIYLWCPIS